MLSCCFIIYQLNNKKNLVQPFGHRQNLSFSSVPKFSFTKNNSSPTFSRHYVSSSSPSFKYSTYTFIHPTPEKFVFVSFRLCRGGLDLSEHSIVFLPVKSRLAKSRSIEATCVQFNHPLWILFYGKH